MKKTDHLETHAEVLVDAYDSHTEHEPNVADLSGNMVIMTWVSFGLFLAILYKIAWKPILKGLDDREQHLREAIEQADKTKAEYERLEQRSKEVIQEAKTQGKEIVEQSRKAAQEAAKTIERKAKEEGQIMVENATTEINQEKQKAQAELRAQSAQIAVELASKIIEENLDNEKNKKLVNQMIKEL